MKPGAVALTIDLPRPTSGWVIADAVRTIALENGNDHVKKKRMFHSSHGGADERYELGQSCPFSWSDVRIEVQDGGTWTGAFRLDGVYACVRVVNWSFAAATKLAVGIGEEAVLRAVRLFHARLADMLRS